MCSLFKKKKKTELILDSHNLAWSVRSSAEVSVHVSAHFFVFNDRRDRQTELRIAASWKSIATISSKQQKKEKRLHSRRSPCEDRDGKIFATKCRQKHVCGVIVLQAMHAGKLKSKLKGWMTCLWSENKEPKKGQKKCSWRENWYVVSDFVPRSVRLIRVHVFWLAMSVIDGENVITECTVRIGYRVTGSNDLPGIMIGLTKIKIKTSKIHRKYHYIQCILAVHATMGTEKSNHQILHKKYHW